MLILYASDRLVPFPAVIAITSNDRYGASRDYSTKNFRAARMAGASESGRLFSIKSEVVSRVC
jgi:hypothetical protein